MNDVLRSSENIGFMIVFLGQAATQKEEYSQSKLCSWQPSIGGKPDVVLAGRRLRAAHRLRSLYLSAGTRETRKPRPRERDPGSARLRNADRQYPAGRIQLPPRITRSEPVAAPVGSSTADSL